MGKLSRPRFGSLQFWPRKRAKKILPSVNWKILEDKDIGKTFLGAIAYRVGMCSAIAKDNTANSLTKGKSVVLPITVLECPPMKILGVRFYKNGIPALDILAPNLDKELKRKLKLPKKDIDMNVNPENFDNIRILVYSEPKKAAIKKTPDITEIAIKGKSVKEKFEIAKEFLGKEISINDIFDKNQLVDIHAVTKAKGFAGPVKRFGISYRQHKSEKGVKRPGSLGPWHPARVTFKVPMAGQLGFFTRVQHNNKLLDLGNVQKSFIEGKEFLHYGKLNTKYCIIKGSVAGTVKRPVLLTFSIRPTKKLAKQNFEITRIV